MAVLSHSLLINTNTCLSKSKAQPKRAGAVKATDDATRGTTRGRGGRVHRGRNAGRPKPKTADELDAEMTDYFVGGTAANGTDAGAAATNGAASTAGGDDLGMDEISVRSHKLTSIPPN